MASASAPSSSSSGGGSSSSSIRSKGLSALTGSAAGGYSRHSRLYQLRLHTWRTFEDPSYSTTSQFLSYFIIVTICTSIINFSIASYPKDLCRWRWTCADGSDGCEFTGSAERECSEERVEAYDASAQIETVCIIIFTAEYVIRIACCGTEMSPLRFFFKPFNLLDLIAIAPWYVVAIMTAVLEGSMDSGIQRIFGVVRIVRLTRVLRIFKVSKGMKMMMVLFSTLHRSLNVLMLLLFMVMILMLGFGAFLIVVERGEWNPHLQQFLRADGTQSPFLGIPDAMYWCMATMTTVGYGDLYPITTPGWLVGIAGMLAGTVILSLPITVIGATFSEEYMEQERINAREKRLQQHNISLGIIEPPAKGGSFKRASSQISMVAKLGKGKAPEAAPAAAPSSQPPIKAGAPSASKAAATIENAASAGRFGMEKPVAGLIECEWLLQDFHESTMNDFKSILAKSEQDLLRMSRKVIIHSRIFGSSSRSKELPPGGADLDELQDNVRRIQAIDAPRSGARR